MENYWLLLKFYCRFPISLLKCQLELLLANNLCHRNPSIKAIFYFTKIWRENCLCSCPYVIVLHFFVAIRKIFYLSFGLLYCFTSIIFLYRSFSLRLSYDSEDSMRFHLDLQKWCNLRFGPIFSFFFVWRLLSDWFKKIIIYNGPIFSLLIWCDDGGFRCWFKW